MGIEQIYEAVVRVAAERLGPRAGPMQHLDIGAGRGELIGRLRDRIRVVSEACDYHVERFQLLDVPIARVDLDAGPLPFPDDRFDLVTCSEVLEHLENYRHLVREAYRVAKPGGLLVVTTPNVLNMASRVRYVTSGFGNLFGPLPLRNDRRHSTGGHLTPVPYFYLAHALADAGFADIRPEIDRRQKTSLFWLALTFPIVYLGWRRFLAREGGRYRTLTPENERHVRAHASLPLLLGRTLVVSAHKPLRT